MQRCSTVCLRPQRHVSRWYIGFVPIVRYAEERILDTVRVYHNAPRLGGSLQCSNVSTSLALFTCSTYMEKQHLQHVHVTTCHSVCILHVLICSITLVIKWQYLNQLVDLAYFRVLTVQNLLARYHAYAKRRFGSHLFEGYIAGLKSDTGCKVA